MLMKIIKTLLLIVLIYTCSNAQIIKQIGDEFYVKARIANGIDITGISCYIGYDPAVIEVVDINPSVDGTQVDFSDLGYLSGATLLMNILKPGATEEPGTLVIGYVSLSNVPSSGDGDLFRWKMKAKAPGVTTVVYKVEGRQLSDVDGGAYNHDEVWHNLPQSITVEEPVVVEETILLLEIVE